MFGDGVGPAERAMLSRAKCFQPVNVLLILNLLHQDLDFQRIEKLAVEILAAPAVKILGDKEPAARLNVPAKFPEPVFDTVVRPRRDMMVVDHHRMELAQELMGEVCHGIVPGNGKALLFDVLLNLVRKPQFPRTQLVRQEQNARFFFRFGLGRGIGLTEGRAGGNDEE